MEAAGSLTIKRLRKGRNIILGFTVNGALFQGWNPITKVVEPSFETAENRPTVTPNVYASDGSTVTIGSSSAWYWNNMTTPIQWNAASGTTRTSTDGMFQENTETHALTFIKDLASATNMGSDTFYFVANGEAGGVNYTCTGNFEFKIQEISSSGYTLTTSGGNAITAELPTVKVTAYVYSSGVKDTTKVVKWYTTGGNLISTGYSATIKQEHVSGQGSDAGVVCMVYEKEGDTVALASTFHQINDFTDNFDVEAYIDGSTTEWNGSDAITVNARLRNMRTMEVIETGVTWKSSIYDSKVDDPVVTDIAGLPLSIGKTYWDLIGKDSDLRINIEATFTA